jgi:hypothetical protein
MLERISDGERKISAGESPQVMAEGESGFHKGDRMELE